MPSEASVSSQSTRASTSSKTSAGDKEKFAWHYKHCTNVDLHFAKTISEAYPFDDENRKSISRSNHKGHGGDYADVSVVKMGPKEIHCSECNVFVLGRSEEASFYFCMRCRKDGHGHRFELCLGCYQPEPGTLAHAKTWSEGGKADPYAYKVAGSLNDQPVASPRSPRPCLLDEMLSASPMPRSPRSSSRSPRPSLKATDRPSLKANDEQSPRPSESMSSAAPAVQPVSKSSNAGDESPPAVRKSKSIQAASQSSNASDDNAPAVRKSLSVPAFRGADTSRSPNGSPRPVSPRVLALQEHKQQLGETRAKYKALMQEEYPEGLNTDMNDIRRTSPRPSPRGQWTANSAEDEVPHGSKSPKPSPRGNKRHSAPELLSPSPKGDNTFHRSPSKNSSRSMTKTEANH